MVCGKMDSIILVQTMTFKSLNVIFLTWTNIPATSMSSSSDRCLRRHNKNIDEMLVDIGAI